MPDDYDTIPFLPDAHFAAYALLRARNGLLLLPLSRLVPTRLQVL